MKPRPAYLSSVSASPATKATSSLSTTSSSQSGGLTTPAQAGIGAGVGVAAVLFLASCYYFYITRRNRKYHQGFSGERMNPEQEAQNEQFWVYKGSSQHPDWAAPTDDRYSKGSGCAELPSNVRLWELPPNECTSELDVEEQT